jgi:hypothetical protein
VLGFGVCEGEGLFGGVGEVVEVFAAGAVSLCWSFVHGWYYHVRRKHIWSFVEQEERIRPWISGGKERKGAKVDVDMIV